MSDLSDYAEQLKRDLKLNAEDTFLRAQQNAQQQMVHIQDIELRRRIEEFDAFMLQSLCMSLHKLLDAVNRQIDEIARR